MSSNQAIPGKNRRFRIIHDKDRKQVTEIQYGEPSYFLFPGDFTNYPG